MRRTCIARGCLYCGLQLPDSAKFCPECGRPIEDAIRIESGGKMRRTYMAKGCLYCGLQLPDSAKFCPECGRPIERGFKIRPIQESELDCLRKDTKRKYDLTDSLLTRVKQSCRERWHVSFLRRRRTQPASHQKTLDHLDEQEIDQHSSRQKEEIRAGQWHKSERTG